MFWFPFMAGAAAAAFGGTILRPVARTAIRGGVAVSEGVRDLVNEAHVAHERAVRENVADRVAGLEDRLKQLQEELAKAKN